MYCLKGQRNIDEFALILLAVFIFMGILMITWTTPTEFPPKIQPTSLSFSIQSGLSSSFDLNVSGKITSVNLSSSGKVGNWIKFGNNNFDVISGSVIVPATISVPKNTAAGTYKGTISVASTGGRVDVPVTVEVTQITKVTSRSISLGDLSIGFVSGATVAESKESVSIMKGYFYEKDFDMNANVEEKNLNNIKSGELLLDIGETNSYGNLIIIFNEQEIFNSKVAAGELSIPIDKSLVKKMNTIKIKADNPGFFFWANTVYNIKLAKFSINLQGAFAKDVEFTLRPEEVTNFDHMQLTFRVKDYSTPLPELTLAVNGQKIFFAKPELGFFNRNFASDLSGNVIKVSNLNKITFSFDQQAFYDIGDVVLTIFYGV